jgi:nitrite reductase/ring-hydroxylating ferredoxin subunit
VTAFITTGPADALSPGHGKAVAVGRDAVALFRVDDAIYATEAWCLRCGSGLAEGRMQGRFVVCRGCDWRYDVTTGALLGLPSLRLHVFDTKVIDGQIAVATP